MYKPYIERIEQGEDIRDEINKLSEQLKKPHYIKKYQEYFAVKINT
jgi:hypothetical protein